MPTVAIVDDEAKYRTTDIKSLKLKLPKGWTAIGIPPLPHLGDYPSWIAENDVAVLLVDQELGRQSSTGGDHVDYKGDDLVKSLRGRNKTLPIYFLTNFSEQDDVKDRKTDVEGTFDKKDFRKRRADYVKRITRKGKEYFNSVKAQLTQLNQLSLKIAKGQASETERKEAKAIQTSLEIPLATETFNDRSDWVAEYEKRVEEFEVLKKEIEVYLKAKARTPSKKK
jgi:hypothetical protein